MEIIYDKKTGEYIYEMSEPVWTVTDVEAKEDYTLLLTFRNGEKKIYDVKPLLNKTIYQELKKINLFLQAKVDGDTVIWNDDIDIAPEHLYENSQPICQ